MIVDRRWRKVEKTPYFLGRESTPDQPQAIFLPIRQAIDLLLVQLSVCLKIKTDMA
jgi:hypothetical protein